MCGLTGFLDMTSRLGCEDLRDLVNRMATTLYRRGPDDSGEWVDAHAGIALGFRRLAILDLTPTGHQPMLSASGRYVMVFNGEVYNFRELRQEMEAQNLAPAWRGSSDTEVMLAAFEAWGIANAVQKFIGMFAIALWDRKERTLHLVRDRIGIKPLYYGWAGNSFLFGSELKALRAHPDFEAEIDRNSLALMLRYDYIPCPYSIYKGISKLPPGTILTLRADRPAPLTPVPYWSLKEAVEQGSANPFPGTESEAVEQLDTLLRQAVSYRMISDVPLGVFLSGGVDSTTVTALMQAQSSRPIKTFTIGFHEDSYNEAQYASAVAKHLQTDHTEFMLSASEALTVIPHLPALYDEPFADASQLPTYCVAEMARRHVTVSLSGDGGDELFAGYIRHYIGRSLWQKLRRVPRGLRGVASSSLKILSPQAWEGLLKSAKAFLPGSLRQQNSGRRFTKFADILLADNPEAMYMTLVSHWENPTELVPNSCEPPTALSDRAQWAALPDFTQRMLFLDAITYLPDGVLVKVDRASMGVSLEAREPLLDHRVFEFAWTLPLEMKIREGQGKWLLRQVLYKYVPKSLIERPKAGFSVPIHAWLRGPLRDWAESLLSECALKERGFFNPQPIRAKWADHLSGKHDYQDLLWSILMFQAWVTSL